MGLQLKAVAGVLKVNCRRAACGVRNMTVKASDVRPLYLAPHHRIHYSNVTRRRGLGTPKRFLTRATYAALHVNQPTRASK